MSLAVFWGFTGALAFAGVLIVVAVKPRRQLVVFYLGCLALSIVTYVVVPLHGSDDFALRVAGLFAVIFSASVWVAVKSDRIQDIWAFAVLGMLAIATPVFAFAVYFAVSCAGGDCL